MPAPDTMARCGPLAWLAALATVSSVAVYTDYKLDESYTPTRISVRYHLLCNTAYLSAKHSAT